MSFITPKLIILLHAVPCLLVKGAALHAEQ